MSVQVFLALLLAFSAISSLVTETIKKVFATNDENLCIVSYKDDATDGNITAFIVSIIVGLVGTLIYYELSVIEFSVNNIIYAILMGLASSLTSQVGYDKVKETIQKFIL